MSACFKCNDNCFRQVDGLAMGASLAQANIWLNSFENQIKSTKRSSINSLKMSMQPSVNATVKSPMEEKESSEKNVTICSMQNARILNISSTPKGMTWSCFPLIAIKLTKLIFNLKQRELLELKQRPIDFNLSTKFRSLMAEQKLKMRSKLENFRKDKINRFLRQGTAI